VNSMRTRLASASYRVLFTLWRKTPLGRVANAISGRLPTGLRRWIEQRRHRLKQRRHRLMQNRRWRLHEQQRLREWMLHGHPHKEKLEDMYRNALMLVASEPGASGVGDYLEFGVYVGGTLLCMHRASKAVGLESIRLFGFDSFQGAPQAAATDDVRVWQPGSYRAEYGLVREHLTRSGIDWTRTVLVPGWFEDTLTPTLAPRLGIDKAGVVMIDSQLYSSARTALDFCAPLIRDRAVVVLNNWNAGGLGPEGLGEGRAFEEFLATNRDLAAEELPSFSYFDLAKVFLVTRVGAETRGADIELR
jgi:O-methyltransferase